MRCAALLSLVALLAVAPGAGARPHATGISQLAHDVNLVLSDAATERAKDLTCQELPRPVPHTVPLSAATPSAGLVASLGVLRRPQTAEEQALTPMGRVMPARVGALMSEGYATATRIVTVEGGQRAVIAIGRADTSYLLSKAQRKACAAKYLAAVRRRAARAPRTVRTTALRTARRLSRAPAPIPARDALVFGRFVDGKFGSGGSGPSTAADLRGGPAWTSEAIGGGVVLVTALVPDGVDAVTVTDKGRGGPTITATAAVHENIAIVRFEGSEFGGPDASVVWKRADGSIVQPQR